MAIAVGLDEIRSRLRAGLPGVDGQPPVPGIDLGNMLSDVVSRAPYSRLLGSFVLEKAAAVHQDGKKQIDPSELDEQLTELHNLYTPNSVAFQRATNKLLLGVAAQHAGEYPIIELATEIRDTLYRADFEGAASAASDVICALGQAAESHSVSLQPLELEPATPTTPVLASKLSA